VPLVATELVEPTRVSVDGTPLTYGKDWSSLGAFADLQVSAPLVFVGHGLVSKKFGRDDLKDVDLRGTIAFCGEGRCPVHVVEEERSTFAAGRPVGLWRSKAPRLREV
jgi:hypothetical protein